MSSNTSLIKDKGRKRTLSESYESVLFLFILRHRKLTNYFFKEDKKGANLREKTLKFAPKRVGHRFKSYPKACFDHLHPVFGYEKSPETLVGSGDFVCASFLYRHLGCGDGI